MDSSRSIARGVGLAAFALFFASCAISQSAHEKQGKKSASSEQAMQTVEYDKGVMSESASVKFKKGKAELTKKDKETLREVAQDVKKEGKISRAKIVVWADKEHPEKGSLAKEDRDLAQKRANNIEKFLKKEVSVTSIRTFSMAENKDWLARNIDRSEDELQSVFAKKGEAPVSEKEFKLIKDEGGPSKSIVILEHEAKKLK